MSKNPKQEIQQASPKSLERVDATVSERFLADVERQFLAQMGTGVEFTATERRLVQHMYLAVDQALKAAEAKRTKGWTEAKLKTAHEDPRAFTWHHIDRQKLALDTVHRVQLGLDALVPNHIWPIAYFNGAKNQYDIDLRIGYLGRDLVARRYALEQPKSITYQLVFSTDEFKALPKSSSRPSEGFEFEINSPFDRGDIVGGFGYIEHEDPAKNQLVLVTQRDFTRSKGASRSDFWAKHDVEMHLKTVYHRTLDKITLDPAKVNAEVLGAMRDDDPVTVAHRQIDEQATAVANTVPLELEAASEPPGEVSAPAGEAEQGELLPAAPF